MADGLGSKTYSYNELSQMTSETQNFGAPFSHSYTLNYAYNLAGELKTFTSSFGETLNYGFDSVGRVQTIGASGYYPSQFLTGATYRAWGSLKSAGFGDGVTESAGYDSRLQMTSRQMQTTGYQPSNYAYQYYADGGLRFSQSADNRFDGAFTYDQAARITEAYSGSEARDYINNTNSGTPTGPYRRKPRRTRLGPGLRFVRFSSLSPPGRSPVSPANLSLTSLRPFPLSQRAHAFFEI